MRIVASLCFLFLFSFSLFLSPFSVCFRFLPSRVCVLSPLLRVPFFPLLRCLSVFFSFVFCFSLFSVPVHFSLRLADSYFFVSSKKCIAVRSITHPRPMRSPVHCSCCSHSGQGESGARARTRCVGDTRPSLCAHCRCRPSGARRATRLLEGEREKQITIPSPLLSASRCPSHRRRRRLFWAVCRCAGSVSRRSISPCLSPSRYTGPTRLCRLKRQRPSSYNELCG